MPNSMHALTLALMACAALAVEPPPPYNDHCIVGIENRYNKSHADLVKWYTVDLDVDAMHRWDEVAIDYAPRIKALIELIKTLSRPLFQNKLIEFVDKYLGPWDKLIKQPYHDELVGISHATNITLGEIVLYNVFYEVFTVCTSIIAADANGTMYHARNLDFGLFMGWNHETHNWDLYELLRPMVINVNWTKGGLPLFKSVNFAGYIGVYNGLKQNKFTISMNERFNIDGGYLGIIEWLLGLSPNVNFCNFLTRDVLTHANDYTEAVTALASAPIIAPAYYIVGGTSIDKAIIIARSREGTVEFTTADDNGIWYVLETNYDQSKAPLYIDDRRTPGHICMKRLGQSGVSFAGIYNVLSSKTNLNKLTEYTVLMQVDSGDFETHLQSCPQPCFFA